MSQALALAQKAKGTTLPNPAVGAVIVSHGTIVGRGCTSEYGGPHAEKNAIADAGSRAKRAILYVTLEPCNHFGKTPPCTDAIIAAGITSVFVSITDPNPLVSGRGIRRLRKQGIKVYTGLLRREAYLINEDFFWAITTKQPWITLKLALTLDGRIADDQGRSRWITSAASRSFVHTLRRKHGAIAVGATTLLKDNPKLTVRRVSGPDPVRIVFSSGHGFPGTSYFKSHAKNTRSIVVIEGGKKHSIEHTSDGLELWYTGYRSRAKSIRSFLRLAYKEGLTSILVEGGQRLASAFLENRCVNRVYLMYGNKLLGKGLEGFSFRRGLPLAISMELKERAVETFGSDVMITGIPVWK